MKTIELNNNPIVTWGDTHGNWEHLTIWLKTRSLKDINVIQVGDFGVGFLPIDKDKRRLERLNDKLAERNCTLYVIRGNHDCPDYFNGFINILLTHIVFVEDYTILTQENTNILCVGGAISVDRVQRKEWNRKNRNAGFLSWYKREVFNYDEEKINKIIENLYIDVVITHTAPTNFYPYGFNEFVHQWAKRDINLLDDLVAERNKMQDFFNKFELKPRYWIYGHFHPKYEVVAEIEGVTCICLPINDFKQLRV